MAGVQKGRATLFDARISQRVVGSQRRISLFEMSGKHDEIALIKAEATMAKTATIKRNHAVSDEEMILLCSEAFEADPDLDTIEFEANPPTPMPLGKFTFIQTDSKA